MGSPEGVTPVTLQAREGNDPVSTLESFAPSVLPRPSGCRALDGYRCEVAVSALPVRFKGSLPLPGWAYKLGGNRTEGRRPTLSREVQ